MDQIFDNERFQVRRISDSAIMARYSTKEQALSGLEYFRTKYAGGQQHFAAYKLRIQVVRISNVQ